MNPDLTLCLESWAEELNARASRIRQLIGDKHWLSDGHQKEYVIREFLSRHLPSNLNISRGFVRPPDSENPISGELDVLISDFAAHPPWFNEGGVVIAPPSSVKSQIHVKTSLGSEEIADVLISTSKAYLSMSKYIDISTVWSGALFFDTSKPADKSLLEKRLQVWIQYFVFDLGSRKPTLAEFPNCIATTGGLVVFFDKRASETSEIGVRAFDCGRLASAVLLGDMFEHIRVFSGCGQKRGALAALLEKIETNAFLKMSFELKPKKRKRSEL